MAKVKIIYACQHCGAQYSKWQGQCAECQKWNTISEEQDESAVLPQVRGYAGEVAKLTPLSKVSIENLVRIPTGLGELDHVLGGGMVRDAVTLIGGDPGVGKSTILLQLLCHLPEIGRASCRERV